MNELPMPLLDIATAQPSFQNHLCLFRSQILYQGNGCRRLSSLWRSFEIPEKENKFNVGKIRIRRRCGMLINAVATLEPTKCLIESNVLDDYHKLDMDINSKTPQVVEHQSSSEEDSSELDDREKLRRMRISKANKGNTPWNKGRKHSPETLRRIRERTRLAMQDPKVKMKLVNLGHAQSKETRIKIGAGVRIGWNKRREKLMLQETCHFQWQNLIADASRRGLVGEEELQWDSYKILDEQLEKEWLESVEMRKRTPRPQGSKRAPKSAEQRRKISEAIAAKWADPSYRDRVYSGLSKYHGTPIGVAKPRRRPTSDRPRRISPTKKKGDLDDSAGNETKSQNQRARAKKNKVPTYKDPLASTKLEMIKNIRAQRENKKAEAITRAKVLIAEAEKAAKALEVTATRSPLAQASLIETRKLIAEAIQSIESVETGEGDFDLENGQNLQSTSTGIVNHLAKEIDMRAEGVTSKDQIQVNGAPALASSSNGDISDFGFEDFNLQDLLNCDEEILPSSSSYDHHLDLLNGKDHLKQLGTSDFDLSQLESGHKMESSGYSEQTDKVIPNGSSRRKKLSSKKPPKSIKITKKWVCGKLVEVVDED